MHAVRIIIVAAFLAGSVVALNGCERESHAVSDAANIKYAVLDETNRPLRDDFDRDKGNVRLLLLMDPRCPGCLMGLANIDRDLLSKLPPSARVKVYIVYEPVIGGAAKDIPAAAGLLHTTQARHYWSEKGLFGQQFAEANDLHHDGKLVYAWDVWTVYGPDAVWNDAVPPRPTLLMHQLVGLMGDKRFPFLNSAAYAAEVRTLLAGLPKGETPQ